jgi:hypothetical protein
LHGYQHIDEFWTLRNESFMQLLLHLSAPSVNVTSAEVAHGGVSHFPIAFASLTSNYVIRGKLMEKYLEPIELNDAELAAVAGGFSVSQSNSTLSNSFNNSDIGDTSVAQSNSTISNSTIGG